MSNLSKEPDFIYISTSLICSLTANSIHVMNQVSALSKCGGRVRVYVGRQQKKEIPKRKIEDYYGTNLDNVDIISIYVPDKFRIIAIALYCLIREIPSIRKRKIFFSRNYYASFLMSILRVKSTFEMHHIEPAGWKRWIQKISIRSKRTKIIAISKGLANDINNLCGSMDCNVHVLPDAAADMKELEHNSNGRIEVLDTTFKDKLKVGYFGSIDDSRGMKIIEQLSVTNPEIIFIVAGKGRLDKSSFDGKSNFYYMGALTPRDARLAQTKMEILLMPYQKKVLIGERGYNTVNWMSPLKLFEYMSSESAIICSDLPVLREVVDSTTVMFVDGSDIKEWNRAIKELVKDEAKRKVLARNAYKLFEEKYTWKMRAKQIRKL